MDGACVAGFLSYCPQLARVECVVLAGDVLLSSKSLEFFAMRSGDAFVQVRHCPKLKEIEVAQWRNLNLVGPCEELTALRVSQPITNWSPHSSSLLALSASLPGLPKLARLHFSTLAPSAPISELSAALSSWILAIGNPRGSADVAPGAHRAIHSFAETHFLPQVNSWLASTVPGPNAPSAAEFEVEELAVTETAHVLLSSNLPFPSELPLWLEWRRSPFMDATGELQYLPTRVTLADQPSRLAARIGESLRGAPRPRRLRTDNDRCLLVVYDQV